MNFRPSPVIIALLSLATGGCATADRAAAPPSGPSARGLGQAYHDAQVVAGSAPGRRAAVGQGQSMAPVYGESTVLVFNPIAYGDLRPGMNVAYLNSEGRQVVHRLLQSTPDGWTVVGLNNTRIDADLVTPRNLLGVVYATVDADVEDAAAPAPGSVPRAGEPANPAK